MSAARGTRRSEGRVGASGDPTAAAPAATASLGSIPAQTATAPTPTSSGQPAANSGNRLVFGLSSRTNRLKHDEYAEKRSGSQQQQPIQQQPQPMQPSQAQRQPLQQQQPQSAGKQVSSQTGGKSQTIIRSAMNENGLAPDNKQANSAATAMSTKTPPSKSPAETGATPKPRASKYGNFYKPQDLLGSAATTTASRAESSIAESPVTDSHHDKKAEQQQPDKKQKWEKTSSSKASLKENRSRSPARPNGSTLARKKSVSSAAAATVADSPTTPTNSRPANRSSSPSSREQAASPIKTDSSNNKATAIGEDKQATSSTTGTSTSRSSSPAAHSRPASPSVQQQQQPTRMQFNIPPPPKINTNHISKSTDSVVSYAKSRIYDKPTRQFLSNSSAAGAPSGYGPSPLLLHDSGAIPQSILSGIKPPKQVVVSKAREKWEGGEPFAKCKSRQRLAQASKKLLHGAWSMTSVVATQQLQLQQALAQSSAGVSRSSSSLKNDPAVKILTRGSVLERIQQYEKAPGSQASRSSNDYGYDDDDDYDADNIYDYASYNSLQHQSATGGSNTANEANGASPGGACLTISGGSAGTTGSNIAGGPEVYQSTSKQAIYKSRVSSIQSAGSRPQDHHPLLSMIPLTSKQAIGGVGGGGGAINKSAQSAQGSQEPLGATRRLSFRRRSSVGGVNNSNSIIPKFYHPNGKPNTYEIELQKKNIVACFDKFPDRKALLSGPNCRRHFHAISLACGFSEYFKEPLLRYVKHQLTNSNLLHNTSYGDSAGASGTLQRKQSGAGLLIMTNGINSSAIRRPSITSLSNGISFSSSSSSSSHQQQPKQMMKPGLVRAASIDNSTMEKIQSQNYISCDQFLICWRNIISSCFDLVARFVHLLTLGQRNHLIADDFVPLIQSIIEDHPGLKFLRAAPDFHMRYIQTVVARIYFCINRSWTGKVSLTELRRSNLLAVLQVLSQEEDINQITDYFSYEHFYVIYCKFWSLDKDHDLLISKEDLARHNDAAISSRIIERIFMGIVSKQIQQTGKMSYSDFVWFLIAEEDKKHPRSIEYWFRLMDIDGDGYISMYEMEYFYYEQMKRLELMNIEALPFNDSACQILDLVNPREKNKIALSDLKRTKMATIFFDTFINLEKYLEHESREFVSTRDVVQDGVVISDWDRYASEEYESLITEESAV